MKTKLTTTVLAVMTALSGKALADTHITQKGAFDRDHQPGSKSISRKNTDLRVDKRNEVSPLRVSKVNKSRITKAAGSCELSRFAQASGQALVDLVLAADVDCISTFSTDKETSKKVYNNANMLTLAQAAESLSKSYSASTTDPLLGNLYYVLRLAYFLNYTRPTEIPKPSDAVIATTTRALDALVANPHFYDNSQINGEALRDAIVLIDVSKQHVRYLPQLKQWFSRWNASYDKHHGIKAAMNEMITTFYGGFFNPDFVKAIDNDASLVDSLSQFIAQDWMLTSSAKLLQSNAALTLAYYLDPEREPLKVRTKVKGEITSILSRYKMVGTGDSVWLVTADLLDQFGLCNEFNICNFRTSLAEQILKSNHTCSNTLKMRAQDMTAPQFTSSCEVLAAQESYFHAKLNTAKLPVANDLNKDLEMAIFNDTDSYDLYGSVIFEVDLANSGGMYLEGEPSNSNNQARFLAYEDVQARPDFAIWNLAHEYVHYLDGRYNMKGNFEDARIDTHKTLWWVEGLAEYISHKDKYDEAIEAARTGAFKLSEIFSNTYDSGQQRVYRWGYLAVRFMFEKHPSDVDKILTLLRNGQYDDYLAFINSLTGYEQQWQAWLAVVKSESTPDSGDGGSGDGGSGDGGSGDDSGDTHDQGVIDLSNGSYLTNLEVARQNGSLSFYLDLPENIAELVIVMSDGQGDADLSVLFDYMPTDDAFDCRPKLVGNDEVCRIETPQAGAWFIQLKANSPFSGVSLQVAY